jgi:hypothetical protein
MRLRSDNGIMREEKALKAKRQVSTDVILSTTLRTYAALISLHRIFNLPSKEMTSLGRRINS